MPLEGERSGIKAREGTDEEDESSLSFSKNLEGFVSKHCARLEGEAMN